jgi:CrcB protein
MTAPGTFLLICIAGGLGSALRYAVDAAVTPRVRAPFPVATMLINVSGSLLLGLLTGLAATTGLPREWLLVLGGGLLGGYTTFSTASVEAVRLLRSRRVVAAVAYGLGVAVLAVAAAALGIGLGVAVGAPL